MSGIFDQNQQIKASDIFNDLPTPSYETKNIKNRSFILSSAKQATKNSNKKKEFLKQKTLYESDL
jgi:hypothetical protein